MISILSIKLETFFNFLQSPVENTKNYLASQRIIEFALLMEIKASVRHDYPLPTSFFKIRYISTAPSSVRIPLHMT
ncbi:MAG: hypothetical protein US13_C0001G0001, partial [candidate division TM6 bacterium GW2011_GWE2_36_25]